MDVIKQIRDGALFGHYVGQNFDDKQLVTIGKKLILDTGLFAQQYANWKRRPPENREWGDFEPFWTRELDLWHETTWTAAQSGYAGNVNGKENKQEYE